MHHFGCPECEASANLGVANVDLNKDAPLRVPRMRGFCEFRNRKRRPYSKNCLLLRYNKTCLLLHYSRNSLLLAYIRGRVSCPEIKFCDTLQKRPVLHDSVYCNSQFWATTWTNPLSWPRNLVANVDLNRDAPLLVLRTRGFCKFRNPKRRPQQGCKLNLN